MEKRAVQRLTAIPSEGKPAGNRDQEPYRFILAVLALYTAMHGRSLILDWIDNRPPRWVNDLIDPDTADDLPTSMGVICFMRAFIAYSFVGSWSWHAAGQIWPDVLHSRPTSMAMLQGRRQALTIMIFHFYLTVCEGVGHFMRTLTYWAMWMVPWVEADADVRRAATSTVVTSLTYLTVYSLAWFVSGMWYRPGRERGKDSGK